MKLHWKIEGNPNYPPLLMCNGLGASIDSWGQFGRNLAEHHRLFMFDAPGCGDSSVASSPYGMRTLANSVVEQMGRFGVDEFDVAGYSFGGALSQTIAANYPDRVNKLALCSTISGIGGVMPAPHVLALAANPFRFCFTTLQETIAPILYGGDAGTLSGKKPSLVGVMHQLFAIGSWTGVDGITAPTLVLGGDDDPLTPVGNVKKLVGKIPGATGVVIPDAGHLAIHNNPEYASQLVLNHFAASTQDQSVA